MSVDPFPFYRGTNHLFWADFVDDPRREEFAGPVTWLQGDMHASNFGAFADDDGQVIYAINDFDETVIADYQFDVWRLAVSIVLVGRDNGMGDDKIEPAVAEFADAYLDHVERFAERGGAGDFVVHAGNARGRLDEFLDDTEDDRSRKAMLNKWTVERDDGRMFDPENDRLAPVEDEVADSLRAEMAGYQATLTSGLASEDDYFAVRDVAKRLDARASAHWGTARYYILVEGPSDDEDDDVILDVKQQGSSTPMAYLGEDAAGRLAPFANEGARIAAGYKALETNIDDHIGWLLLARRGLQRSRTQPVQGLVRLHRARLEAPSGEALRAVGGPSSPLLTRGPAKIGRPTPQRSSATTTRNSRPSSSPSHSSTPIRWPATSRCFSLLAFSR